MATIDPFKLENKIVLLTGGRGFLGQHFTQALRAAGATVIVSDVTDDADLALDVTSQDSVTAAIKQVHDEHGRLDIVINNAAINPRFEKDHDPNTFRFEEYPEELMQQSVNVNLLGTWRVCKAVIPLMRQQGQGNIINIASIYGVTPPRQEIYLKGTEKPVDYAITKAAIIMLTCHIASLCGRDGIRANALAPGGVVRQQDEDFQTRYSAHTSLGRMNTPEEIADALLFLCSDASRGMTGETLVVDAGWSAR